MNTIQKLKKRINSFFSGTYANITLTDYDQSLRGKRVIVTGGTSGIGRAVAKKCLDSGAKVAIVGRDRNKLQKTVLELGGVNCCYVTADLEKLDDNSNLIYEVEQFFEGAVPDCLVNNAGIYTDKPFFDVTAADYNKLLETNLRGTYFLTQIFIKRCIERNVYANIVMVISNRALFGDSTPYGISKKALICYTEGIARDYIKMGIRCNGIAPGMTASGINGIEPEDNLLNNTLGGRVFLSEEIAEVVKFLLSDVSGCISGAIIPCDQGDHLR